MKYLSKTRLATDRLVELQQRFDELESQSVFRRPEDLSITAEYLNPSFLVSKPLRFLLSDSTY